MKRIIIAFAMLSFAITAAILCAVILDKNISELSTEIDKLYTKAEEENNAEIRITADKILDKWSKTEKFLKIVTMHDKINELSKSFLALKHFSQTQNIEEIKQTCAEISVMLNILLSSEEAELSNIL